MEKAKETELNILKGLFLYVSSNWRLEDEYNQCNL